MRHFLANLASYTIAIMLVIGAAVFAGLRSSQLVFSNEHNFLLSYAPAPAHEFDWGTLGRASYVRNCLNCHGGDGTGWDQYPGVQQASRLFAAPGGRDYLIDLHIHGLTSSRWRAPMPPMGHMQDVELAAVLNHVLTHFGNRVHLPPDAQLYIPNDIASRRNQQLSPAQVNLARPDVLHTPTALE